MTNNESTTPYPPSIDSLARHLATVSTLPHAILVDCAQRAVRDNAQQAQSAALEYVHDVESVMLTEVINATGVLLHTNLGRAPLVTGTTGRPTNLEFNLQTGERGSRQEGVSHLISQLIGAESAIVVNNNAAAVMLVVGALAYGRDVAISRGESVEIGGGFRIPDVLEQSGARLVDVGTTNRTRLRDYQKAIESRRNDVALTMKIHPSNFSIKGFTEETTIAELASLEVPVVADIGSGLIDNTCPWLHGHMSTVPAWIKDEPAARQALADGADLVTFSGDKLLGGPQCGIIAGRADLVDACASHPLMRALRPSGLILKSLSDVLLSYLSKTVCSENLFWSMVVTPLNELEQRAKNIIEQSGIGSVVHLESVVGAGSAPGTTIESAGIAIVGQHRDTLREWNIPIISRIVDGTTFLDMRSVQPQDDKNLILALTSLR